MLEKLKKYVLLIAIVIIIIVIMIIYVFMKNVGNESPEINLKNNEVVNNEEELREISEVTDRNKYFIVERILNTYIQYIKQTKGIIDFEKYEDEEIKEEGIDNLYGILDVKYISEMNVKKEDLYNKIKEYEDYNLVIEKIYVYEISYSMDLFFVYGKIDEDNFKLLVKTDSNNMTFSIFLEDYINDKNYNFDMNVNDIDIAEELITLNDNNQYRYVNISDEYMAKQYFEYTKENMLNNIEYVYNNLMEDEYKSERFGSLQEFAAYIDKNREEIEKIEISKYMINSNDNYKEYVCMDNNQNYYIFKEIAVMKFTFVLDTHTIPTQKFTETYKASNEQKKVMMNIDKWVQMLNARDYKAAYHVLNETYRNNTFGSQEQFEEVMRSNLPSYYNVKYDNLREEGKTYEVDITLTDKNEEGNQMKTTIFMQLNENLDFVMSFSIK